MANISSPGIGSGFDVGNLVGQLLEAEEKPATQRLDRREAGLQAELSGFGTLKGAMSALQISLESLKGDTGVSSKAVVSSDDTVATVSVDTGAVPGNFALNVTQLAQANSLVTDASLTAAQFTSLGDVVGTGSLTFTFGTTTYDPNTDIYTPPFVQNPARAAETVQITDGSLSGIRDAVNAADIGVSASIIFDGTNYRLAFAADATGAANSLEITVADDDGNDNDTSGLSLFSFNATSNNLLQTQAAQDALLEINSVSIQSADNVLTQNLDGVTIKLLSTGSTTLTISEDSSATLANINNFVTAYNSLVTTSRGLTAFDTEAQKSGVLGGNAVVRTLDAQLRRILTEPVAGSVSGFATLADIGITRNSDDGTLVTDSSTINDAVKNNPDAIAALFSALGRPDDSLIKYSSATEATQGGSYAVNITQLATQGQVQGASAANLIISSGVNDVLAVTVDNIQTTVTLAAGNYTVVGLMTELQSKLNASSEFSIEDVSVSVSESAGVLTLTSDRYGSGSIAAISGGNGATGLFGSSPSAAAGVDVAGSINGTIATGSGQKLKADIGDAEGLEIIVEGGTLGDRGTVSFGRGYADRLYTLLADALGESGIFETVTGNLNSRIEGVSEDRVALVRRLENLEARLLKQFGSLDILISNLQSTSSFLASQLASLPVIGRGNFRI